MRTTNWTQRFTLSLLLLALLSQLANAQEFVFKPFKATFTGIKWGNEVGEAVLAFEHLAADTYSLSYNSKASMFFLSDKRTEHSIFYLTQGKITPKEYYYSRSGTGSGKSLELKFNKQTQTIEIKGKTNLEWNGEWDNQLYRIDLPYKLSNGQDEIAYKFVNTRGEKREYVIRVEGKDALTLPYGKLEAVKVKLVRESNKRVTYAWFAPSLNYNLVRLQQFKDGEEQGDIQLKTYQEL